MNTLSWEQRRLGEIADIIGGGTPCTHNSLYWNGTIDWYTPAEIGEQIYAEGSIRKISELGLQKCSANILPSKRTILFTSRASIGNMAILSSPSATNQGFQSLVLNKNIHTYYIFSMGSILKEKALSIASGSTFLEISSKQLKSIKIMYTCYTEQKLIGEFFRRLDDRITHHQRKPKKISLSIS